MPARQHAARGSRTRTSRPAKSAASTRSSRTRNSSETPDAAAAANSASNSAETTAEPETTVIEPYAPLQSTIASIYAQAQKSTVGHRKLVIHLRTTFDQCLSGKGAVGSTIGTSGRAGEKLFVRELTRFLNRVLVVKKSEVAGDRCLRFTDAFARNLVGGDKKKKNNKQAQDGEGDVEMEEADANEVVEETPALRVVLRILNHISPYITAKEKVVRYRTSQFLVILLTNTLPDFPWDYSGVSIRIFKNIASMLLKRLQDKEAMVRVQAAIALIRLMDMGVGADEEEQDSDSDGVDVGAQSMIESLLQAMQNDPSADVRRTILYNLTPTRNTLTFHLERARDVDPAARRAVYTTLLPRLGDFRQLTIGQREKLLRWGLNDRDENVRKAAQHMFNFQWQSDTDNDLLEVLERLDIITESPEGGTKDLALGGFWENRKDMVENIEFDDAYWENLTPESVFLVRNFHDFIRSPKGDGLDLEDRIPEPAKLAVIIQAYLNRLVEMIKTEDEEQQNMLFIVEQLLLIACAMDYGDETGRRKMFQLMRNALSITSLSEPITRLLMEGLLKLSINENDYCRLILEVIAEIHDTIEEDDDSEQSFRTASDGDSDGGSQKGDEDIGDTITVRPAEPSGAIETRPGKRQKMSPKSETNPPKAVHKKKRAPVRADSDEEMADVDSEDEDNEAEDDEDEEKAVRELVVNLKCLHIAQCMLENITVPLKSNSHLVALLNGLIVPAARSHDVPVRERGIRCLGLACLLDRTLAEENLMLFPHVFQRGHEFLQLQALHIISDILLIHGASLFESPKISVDQRQLYRMLGKAVKANEELEDKVCACATEVVCKLMLANVVRDEDLLRILVTAYFDPATAGNNALRQTLSYFLPVYCHSSADNARLMADIAVPTLHALLTLREAEGSDMVSAATIAAHIVEWTDPRKCVSLTTKGGGFSEKVLDASTHAVLAKNVLDRVNTPACGKEERKMLINSALAKCWIQREAGDELVCSIYEAVVEAIEGKVAVDATGRNALTKMEVAVGKMVSEIEEEKGGERTILRSEDGGMGEGEEEEEEEEEEGDGTVAPATAEDNEGVIESETERTPAVTDVEESDA